MTGPLVLWNKRAMTDHSRRPRRKNGTKTHEDHLADKRMYYQRDKEKILAKQREYQSRKKAAGVPENAPRCSIDNCGNHAIKRGYCNAHYLRWKRYGDPLTQLRRSPGTRTKEDVIRERRQEYQRHKEAYIARAKKWAAENPDAIRAYFEREDVKEKARQKTKAWTQKNKDRKGAYDREWAANNKPRNRANKAARRARARNATPAWLTQEHREEITAFYDVAEHLERTTGIEHEVDHIIPLSGGIVCGLHVPWNLRVLTRDENNRRPRLWRWEYTDELGLAPR